MIPHAEVMRLLDQDVHPLWRKVNRALIEELAGGFIAWAGTSQGRVTDEAGLTELLIHYLSLRTFEERGGIEKLRALSEKFKTHYARAESEEEKGVQVLSFARELGSAGADLKADERALRRWFGREAVLERHARKVALIERRISLYLGILGSLASSLVRSKGAPEEGRQVWRRLDLEKAVKPLLRYDGDSRLCIAAFRAFFQVLSVLPEEVTAESIDEMTLQHTYRLALDPGTPIWLQISAMHLLQSLSPQSLAVVLREHLSGPRDDRDHLFVRRVAVEILGKNLARLPDLAGLVDHCAADRSPFVRQALPEALIHAPAETFLVWFCCLVLRDAAAQVRASALLAAREVLHRPEMLEGVLEVMEQAGRQEGDPFVMRVWLKVCEDGMQRLTDCDEERAVRWHDRLLPLIGQMHQEAGSLSVRRWAAQTRESLWCARDPQARALRDHLRRELDGVRPGEWKQIGGEIPGGYDEECLGRVLSVLARDGFGYELAPEGTGWKVHKGHAFGFRWWRFLHELSTPSPDKRQAFRHTVGRIFRGSVRAPSAIMAELTETKVPGEPLFIASESGWRPYLPLVDEVLSALNAGETVRIFTSEGVTEIAPPAGLFRRWRARLALTRHFPRLAKQRNWQEGSQFPPSSYVSGLAGYGIGVTFREHASPDPAPLADPAVKRFFPLFVPYADLNLWQRIRDYFFSVYQNSLEQLALFALAITAGFWGYKAYQHYVIRRARQRFPVVIGGWGTRGKSGTERLKAALINALGFSFVSKTTGCEAMFLHGSCFGPLREMYIFRPYDKATIWEQHQIVKLAADLGADFLLWECMGLTPEYVRILQGGWLRDDLSTITNTYPDHEDIQGPAGIDVAGVISEFVPASSVLMTTEELMRPVLAEEARRRGTRVRSAGWLEAGLLTEDVLERFPYKEHPYNVALLLGVAEELGIEKGFVLKEMADRVMPDIGVLKVFPTATVKARRLEFVNGMSANDRFGCLSNWTRTGFDAHDPAQEPGAWVTTLVNNRADRVARSQVFARIICEDLCADRHFLIGSNLKGLMGYIGDAYEQHVRELTLGPGPDAAPEETLRRAARRLRVPTDRVQVAARLQALLKGIGIRTGQASGTALADDDGAIASLLARSGAGAYAGQVVSFIRREREALREYEEFLAVIRAAGGGADRHDHAFRALLKKWFFGKFVLVEDVNATGEEIIARIVAETPPGMLNRIMGMQNIKGTGLDFVYRWQAWDRCHNACERLLGGKKDLVLGGLQELAAFSEFGQLSEEHVRGTVDTARASRFVQSEQHQAEFSVILSALEAKLRDVRGQVEMTRKRGVLFWLIDAAEGFLDAGDSIRRRKAADRIYRDLVAERISHGRAALELQEINKRQKGGWLLTNLYRVRAMLLKQEGGRRLPAS